MTEQIAALDALIEAVETRQLVTIPTPHIGCRTSHGTIDQPKTARIMGYVEGYTVMRHNGAAPFTMTTNAVLSYLKAYRAGL